MMPGPEVEPESVPVTEEMVVDGVVHQMVDIDPAATDGWLAAGEVDLDLLSGTKWAFYPGYEFPGAKGSQRLETVDGRNALIVSYDFSGGGVYVVAGASVDIAEGSKAIAFAVKADRELKLMVRLEDSEKQTLQYQLSYETANEWQTLQVDLTAPPKGSFGGPKDGVIHYPITKLWVGAGKGKSTGEPGEVAVSGFKLVQ